MISFHSPDQGAQAVLDAMRAQHAAADESFVLLAAGDAQDQVLPLLDLLGEDDAPIAGGLFPAILHEGRLLHKGLLLLKVRTQSAPLVFSGASTELAKALDQQLRAPADQRPVSCLVIADGLWDEVGTFLQHLYLKAGAWIRVLGGGAGFADLGHRPCVFTREGLVQDAALLLTIRSACSLGVRHGWDFLMGPMVATRTRGNVILELNWRPAYDVYKEELDPHLDQPLDRQDFGRVAMNFPFAMQRHNAEDVVRDPIAVGSDGSLHCVGLVPENSVLNILCGSADSLIEAARVATHEAYRTQEGDSPVCLHFHCVSRRFYLNERFTHELEVVKGFADTHGGVGQLGALTVGEIATSERGHIEFLNKSVVIGCMRNE